MVIYILSFLPTFYFWSQAFTLDGNWTIVPRHPEEVIGMGQRRRLSPLDIQQANIMYNCLGEQSLQNVLIDP